jgi:hypothetical protein
MGYLLWPILWAPAVTQGWHQDGGFATQLRIKTFQTFRHADATCANLQRGREGRAGRGPAADKLRTIALGWTSSELLWHSHSRRRNRQRRRLRRCRQAAACRPRRGTGRWRPVPGGARASKPRCAGCRTAAGVSVHTLRRRCWPARRRRSHPKGCRTSCILRRRFLPRYGCCRRRFPG